MSLISEKLDEFYLTNIKTRTSPGLDMNSSLHNMHIFYTADIEVVYSDGDPFNKFPVSGIMEVDPNFSWTEIYQNIEKGLREKITSELKHSVKVGYIVFKTFQPLPKVVDTTGVQSFL
jgi:hypothetical protein